jgi:serine/threonine protein kinase
MSAERGRTILSCGEMGSSQSGSSASVQNVPAPGEVIAGKYEVERTLGSGGMGLVVAARHLQLGHRVAVKFAQSKATDDSDAAARFLREARAAAALTSEHVARVLDVGTLDTGEPYIVMEYLTGIDLREVLRKRGAMPIAEAVDAILQACEAIGEAHSIGILHRDLKPANLFLSERRDGSTVIKVLDFGISKSTEINSTIPGESLTASGLVMGSPGYMSPEQIRNAKMVDARTDIWALGVVLYELLTGTHPFAGDTIGDTLAKTLCNSPLCVREYNPAVPRALAETVATCLERNLDERVQTIAQLALRLGPFASPATALFAGTHFARRSGRQI